MKREDRHLHTAYELGKIRKQNLGKYAVAVIGKTTTGLFAVDPEDQVIGNSILKEGKIKGDEIERALEFVTSESNVLVLGGHIGTIAIPIARHCKQVIAFEPNPKSHALLQVNSLLNDIENCDIRNLAVSNKKEKLDFLVNIHNSGLCKRVPQTVNTSYYYDDPKTIQVDAVIVDDELAGQQFDLIIMDIEGSEYFSLQGMQQTLQAAKALIMEYHPGHIHCVSGCTPEALVDLIEPHFTQLYIPSKNIRANKALFKTELRKMWDNDEFDDGIIFS